MNQKSLVRFSDKVPPTLESLPRELKLQVCREMLRSEKPITLSPHEPYVSGFTFGSLGILRVSKSFSDMALGVMYGENCFHLKYKQWTRRDGIFIFEDFDDQDTVDNKSLDYGPWENLRDTPHTLLGSLVSSVDCLDMVSQTSSGQTYLKHLQIDFDVATWVRFIDGVLLHILKRMRGLQSVNLDILWSWDDVIGGPHPKLKENWQERVARAFLLLIRQELSHIKKITVEHRHWIKNSS